MVKKTIQIFTFLLLNYLHILAYKYFKSIIFSGQQKAPQPFVVAEGKLNNTLDKMFTLVNTPPYLFYDIFYISPPYLDIDQAVLVFVN